MGKKKKSKVVWLDRGWYPVSLGFCPSKEAWDKEMESMGIENSPYPLTAGRCTTFEHNDTGAFAMIVTFNRGSLNNFVDFAGIAAHEATHAWQHIKEYIGEGSPGMEVEAYSIQAIAQKLISAAAEAWGIETGFPEC